MKILFFDIETSPNLAYVWEKFEQDVIAFERERELISFAYKWEEGKVKAYCLGDCKSKELVKRLWKLFDEADIIIAHNGNSFDIKMANAFFAHQNLPPPSPYKTIDTLLIAKNKFRFNSNKLNDLGQYLGLGQKVDTGGFKLWLACLKGNKKAWKLMKKYNKQDVVLLEKVYNKLGAWSNTPILREGKVCQKCGSRLKKNGILVTRTHNVQQYKCTSCGKHHYGERYKRDNKIIIK